MVELVILALSNIGIMLLTALIMHRAGRGLGPVPQLRRPSVKFNGGDNEDSDPVQVKGRHIL